MNILLKAWIQGNKTKVVKHYRYTTLLPLTIFLNVVKFHSKIIYGVLQSDDFEIKMGMTSATMATTKRVHMHWAW